MFNYNGDKIKLCFVCNIDADEISPFPQWLLRMFTPSPLPNNMHVHINTVFYIQRGKAETRQSAMTVKVVTVATQTWETLN